MTILWLLAGFGFSTLTGLCLVGACWPRQLPRRSRWLAGSIAIGLGLGISSCSALVWRMWFWSMPWSFVFVDAVLLAGSVWLWRRRGRSQRRELATEPPSDPPVRAAAVDYALAVILGLAIVAASVAMVQTCLRHPHGYDDAWAFWNVKAKFLFYGQQRWADMFSPPLYHVDYPLLLPLNIARLWCYQGSQSTQVPQVLAMLWPLLIVAVLVATMAVCQGVRSACLAGLVLLATRHLLTYSSWQYADAPLSLFMLTALGLTSLWCRWPQKGRSLLVLIGSSAGCAAWTKNEGLLFALVLFLALSSVAAMSRRPLRPVLARYLLGLAPFLLVVLVMKLTYAGSSELFTDQTLPGLVARCTDWSRHHDIIMWTVRSVHHLPDADRLGEVPILLPLLMLYALCAGITRSRADWQATVALGLTLLLMAAGYYTIYLIAHDNLTWHLRTSHGRLLMHLWPSAVLMIFMVLKAPRSCQRGQGSGRHCIN